MNRHEQIHSLQSNDIHADWRKKVNLSNNYSQYRQEFIQMLEPFSKMWDGHLGRISVAKHRIDLMSGSTPVHSAPYRAGPKVREFQRTKINRMFEQEVLESVTTEWAAPIVFAPKKDGIMRFCVDYRRLNAIAQRDSYPIPRIDECIDSLGESTVFSTLDANSGYWKVEIDDRDKDKTAFTSHHGLYRFTRMPFGLKNAPATFQRAMDVIVAPVRWQTALVYLDDIVIFFRTLEEHITHVRQVLSLLQNAGVTLKVKKCRFITNTIGYLGHVIRPRRLKLASHATIAIKQLQEPRNVTKLRSYLGLCSVFRRFVPNFARIAASLNRKLRKDQPKEFGTLNDDERCAMKTLQEKLISPPILVLPYAGEHYTLDTD